MNDNPARIDACDVDRVVGDRVRQAFADADIDNETAADFLGISVPLLLEVFEGNVRCSPVTLMRIAETTGKGVGFFFTGEITPGA